MPDQVTRVTTQSFTSRLTNSVAGIAGGFAMVVAAIAGLAWNENRAVTTARALAGLSRQARPVMGAIFILVGTALLFGVDHMIEGAALRVLPAWLIDLSVSI